MLFNSLEFFIFFIIVFGLYLLLSHRWQNRWLVLASLFFYGWWDWRFLALILFAATVDYICAIRMEDLTDRPSRRAFLLISVCSNLVILGFFKYFNFFEANLVAAVNGLGFSWHPSLLHVILPVGISFFTFQSLGYTIDVYRGQVRAARVFTDFVLFVTFFPQLLAGPIGRAGKLFPQIQRPRTLSSVQFREGCFLIFWGLFEKIFLAGNFAKLVDPVFSAPAPYHAEEVLVALYAFAFQIFCDFDAYSNMARGLGKCMGFELAVNFNLPYWAANPKEFWQRWHISLSTWLRDYLYIPLGGSRGPAWSTCRNLLVTMLLGGLWHGASWTFVLWGGYHGALLVIHRLWSSRQGEGVQRPEKEWTRPIKVLVFFHCVVLGWLFFRARSLEQAGQMLASFTSIFHVQRFWAAGAPLALVLVPLLLVQASQYRSRDLMIILRRHWFVRTFIYALMAYLALGWGVMRTEEFIYFQF